MNTLFPERFAELLKDYTGTYDELAKELGLKSKSNISKYANGSIKNVNIDMIMKIANFFDVSPIWLIGLTDDKHFIIKS